MATKRNFDEQRYDQDGELISTGSANAYVVRGARAVRNNFKGLRIKFRANFTNTGAATLQYGDAPAISIVKLASTALVAGDIISGTYAECIYSDTVGAWQLQNPQVINATTLGGRSFSASGDRWGVIPFVETDGVMEIGRIIDFHNSDADAADNDGRLRSDDIGSAGQDLSWLPAAGADSGILKRLVTARNSTLAQGDIIYYDGSNFVRLAAGTSGNFLQTLGAGANPQWAAPAGGLILLNSGTFSAASTLDIVLTSFTAYRGLKLVLTDILVGTNAAEVNFRVSTNGGSTYDAGAANYKWVNTRVDEITITASGTSTSDSSASDTSIRLLLNANSTAANGAKCEIDLWNQTDTTRNPQIRFSSWYLDSQATPSATVLHGIGFRNAAQDTDAIRVLPSTGTFSGKWALYGLS